VNLLVLSGHRRGCATGSATSQGILEHPVSAADAPSTAN
jgi:hypothetical protein